VRSVDICEQPDAHPRRYAAYGKRAANVSINQGLLEDAKALDINLSFTLKQALQKEVRTRKRAQSLKRSRDTINRNARGWRLLV